MVLLASARVGVIVKKLIKTQLKDIMCKDTLKAANEIL
jgi:hypothetical protein